MSVVKSIEKGFSANNQPTILFIDSDDKAPSIMFRDSFTVPKSSENPKEYMEAILRIHEKYPIDIIMPTSDFDAKVLTAHRDELAEEGILLAMSDTHVYEMWEDKLRFAIDHPEIHPYTSDTWDNMSFPLFAKPRYGVGSRGIEIVHDPDRADMLIEEEEDYIFQELLRGNQYTVDVLCGYNGIPYQAVTRKVFRLKAGSDIVTQIVDSPKMEQIAKSLCFDYGVKGAACFEFMFGEDGEPKLIDAQPRLSGSHIITTRAGLNIPVELIKLTQDSEPPFLERTINYGMSIVRRLEEFEV